METFFVYVLPMLFLISLCIWMRTSVRYGRDKVKFARIFVILTVLSSFVPIANIIIICTVLMYHFIWNDEFTLVENKFNNFMFN